jgi:hypothetical protein
MQFYNSLKKHEILIAAHATKAFVCKNIPLFAKTGTLSVILGIQAR